MNWSGSPSTPASRGKPCAGGLAENDLKPWRRDMWCIPQVDADYVARMEDVLDLYAEAPDPKRPVVCFDESPIQLIGEVRKPIPAKPGQLERYDCEYKRNGTANLFVFLDVNRPWRKVKVTERRAAEDFAACMRELTDAHYPKAERIRVVLDNLSTHSPGALYQTFPAEEARRVLRRLEFHYVPKHASWLNMVEIEIGVLARQCLDRRIDSYTRRRNRRQGEAPQCRTRSYQLDVHNRKSSRQNGSCIPEACRQIRQAAKSQNLRAEVPVVSPRRRSGSLELDGRKVNIILAVTGSGTKFSTLSRRADADIRSSAATRSASSTDGVLQNMRAVVRKTIIDLVLESPRLRRPENKSLAEKSAIVAVHAGAISGKLMRMAPKEPAPCLTTSICRDPSRHFFLGDFQRPWHVPATASRQPKWSSFPRMSRRLTINVPYHFKAKRHLRKRQGCGILQKHIGLLP